jgi:hypothetical protein
MSDVRCPMSDVRCPMSDVRCPMSDVRCPMSDVLGLASTQSKLPDQKRSECPSCKAPEDAAWQRHVRTRQRCRGGVLIVFALPGFDEGPHLIIDLSFCANVFLELQCFHLCGTGINSRIFRVIFSDHRHGGLIWRGVTIEVG